MDVADIRTKYEGQGSLGYLLGAIEFAMRNLSNISSPLNLVTKDATGDIVTEMDRSVHRSVINYFDAIDVPTTILGEEGHELARNPEYAVLIDEIEETQNAVNGLDYGINIAIAPYASLLKVSDLEAAVVTNLRDNTIFVGEKGKGAFKLVNGFRQEFVRKSTDVYECPSPFAYTKEEDQVERQKLLTGVFTSVLGNQPRSVDATGTRLVELVDSNIRAYGDWRNATKAWDVLPSALILRESGYVITDVLGFDLSSAVFYDFGNPRFNKDGGLNRRIGENFIAASPNDHEALVFGNDSDGYNRMMEPNSMWNALIMSSSAVPTPVVINGYGGLVWQDCLDNAALSFNMLLEEVISDRVRAYGTFDQGTVGSMVQKIEDLYLSPIPVRSHIRDQADLFRRIRDGENVDRTTPMFDYFNKSDNRFATSVFGQVYPCVPVPDS